MARTGFIGEIIAFGGNFAPRSWAFCDGQLLAISQNTALFSILGTTYGGDGRTTFGLPDLRGRIPMHAGSGPGLTPRSLGQKSGQEMVTLNTLQIPSHNHLVTATLKASTDPGTTPDPEDKTLGDAGYFDNEFNDGTNLANMSGSSIDASLGNTGGSQAHNNMPPYQTINFIIALQGTYPSRN